MNHRAETLGKSVIPVKEMARSCGDDHKSRDFFSLDQKAFQVGRSLFALCAFYVFTLTLCSDGIAQEYRVEGKFVYDLKLPNGKHLILKRDFYVNVKDCRWEIGIICLEQTNKIMFIHRWDGTNLLYATTLPDDATRVMSGVTEDVSVPYFWTSAGGAFPWLAFASGCYFNTLTNRMSISLRDFDIGAARRRYEVPCDWKLSDLPPFLPYYVNYKMIGLPYVDTSGSIGSSPLPRPFQNGYINDAFKSLSFTNNGLYSVPLAFEFESYVPKPDARKSNDIQRVLLVNGTVTNFYSGRFVGDTIQNRIYVQDRRLPEPAVAYLATNGIIPPIDSPIVTQARELAKLKKMMDETPKPESISLSLLRILVVLTFLGSPFVYWRFKQRLEPRIRQWIKQERPNKS